MGDEDDSGEIPSDAETTPDEGRSDREQNIHQMILRIERLFITGGLRMDFLTPAVLLIVLGSSVAYADSTPTWWDGGLEEQFGVELSVFLLLISGFIIIANIFLIFILFFSLRLNISMFDEHERTMSEQGMTMTNSQGYAEVRRIFDVTRRILRGRTFVLVISFTLVAMSLNPLVDDYRTPLSMLALSSILASLGLQVTAPLGTFNTLEPWGLLDSYQPAVHKTLLSDPFLDLVRAHADPLLHTRMSLHLGEIARRLPGLDMVDFQERLLHLLHLRASTAIDDDEMRKRLSKHIDQDIMDELFDHPELGETTWVRLLSHSAIACPPLLQTLRSSEAPASRKLIRRHMVRCRHRESCTGQNESDGRHSQQGQIRHRSHSQGPDSRLQTQGGHLQAHRTACRNLLQGRRRIPDRGNGGIHDCLAKPNSERFRRGHRLDQT